MWSPNQISIFKNWADHSGIDSLDNALIFERYLGVL